MLLHKNTSEIQSSLSNYCRTGTETELPGTTPGRLHQYRRLVYNVIEDTLAGAFPITRDFLTNDEWHEMVHYFFSNHSCKNNSVWKMPYEFYEFYSESAFHLITKYPFIPDLLYFEWLEIEVHTMPDVELKKYIAEGNPDNDIVYFNPEHKLVKLSYPVHELPPSQLTDDSLKGDYFLLVYRHQDSGDVEFFGLSALFAFIIASAGEEQASIKDLIQKAFQVFGVELNKESYAQAFDFFRVLVDKKFILGYLK